MRDCRTEWCPLREVRVDVEGISIPGHVSELVDHGLGDRLPIGNCFPPNGGHQLAHASGDDHCPVLTICTVDRKATADIGRERSGRDVREQHKGIRLREKSFRAPAQRSRWSEAGRVVGGCRSGAVLPPIRAPEGTIPGVPY